MPLPLAAAASALQAFGTVVDFFVALENYDSAVAAAKRQADDVLRAYALEGTEERVRTAQERAQIAGELEALTLEALGVRGRARAGAAGAGVSGRSVAEVQSDLAVQEQRQRSNLRRTQEFREAATGLRVRGLELQARSAVSSIFEGIPAPPSLLQLGFNLGSSALAGAAQGQQLAKAFG